MPVVTPQEERIEQLKAALSMAIRALNQIPSKRIDMYGKKELNTTYKLLPVLEQAYLDKE